MSPVSLPVLAGALLMGFPALWNSLVAGSTTTFEGLSRFLVTILVSWSALAVLTMLVGPPPREDEDPADQNVADGTRDRLADAGARA